jgi:hypothetical protein
VSLINREYFLAILERWMITFNWIERLIVILVINLPNILYFRSVFYFSFENIIIIRCELDHLVNLQPFRFVFCFIFQLQSLILLILDWLFMIKYNCEVNSFDVLVYIQLFWMIDQQDIQNIQRFIFKEYYIQANQIISTTSTSDPYLFTLLPLSLSCCHTKS